MGEDGRAGGSPLTPQEVCRQLAEADLFGTGAILLPQNGRCATLLLQSVTPSTASPAGSEAGASPGEEGQMRGQVGGAGGGRAAAWLRSKSTGRRLRFCHLHKSPLAGAEVAAVAGVSRED